MEGWRVRASMPPDEGVPNQSALTSVCDAVVRTARAVPRTDRATTLAGASGRIPRMAEASQWLDVVTRSARSISAR